MKKFLFYALLCCISISAMPQVNYPHGNAAYISGQNYGFVPVTIANGAMVYTYDSLQKVYSCGNFILIPDLEVQQNGHYVDKNTFFGYGYGGAHSDTAFCWDKKTLSAPNEFDRTNMFISPVSSMSMSYAQAMQHNATSCNYGYCFGIVDCPPATLAYPMHTPLCDTFDLWLGEDLIDAGDLKLTGQTQKVSQQQTDTTPNRSYCVNRYGRGWRLPTDMEAGHFNDSEGTGFGFDSAYMSSTAQYLWTSSLFKIYTVKRWAVHSSDGLWENCGGFLYVYNYVRCVFPGVESGLITQNNSPAKPEQKVLISPNPSTGVFALTNAGNGNLFVFDQMGRQVKTEVSVSDDHRLDLSDCPDGLYLVKIVRDDEVYTGKILKAGN